DGQLYRSMDAGTSWDACHEGTELCGARLAISPGYEQDGTLFMGSMLGLWRSDDRGARWQRLEIAAAGRDAPVDGLGLSPSFLNDQQLLVHVCGRGLFRSGDRGKTFDPIVLDHLEPAPAFSHMTAFPDRSSLIKFSPNYDQDRTLYVSSMEHLLRSSDGGR